ncbi:hypothetical protein yrohd0001_32700 [Yersinia rohdei ATCC 43380]|nr:hypothetical protein yrohd0001_32700 [Yersinia rohdei ATCC 43380]
MQVYFYLSHLLNTIIYLTTQYKMNNNPMIKTYYTLSE